jgi:ubiquinone/menaquinone biosynthesis C-methylase UbiE
MSEIYQGARLAAVYDALNGAGLDDGFYLELAGSSPKTILDVGGGTGRLACALASRGHNVTCAEPSAAMLDIARTREGADKVMWINAGVLDLLLQLRFDLILMTGHVFQVFLTDAEISSVLHTLRRHLAPQGSLTFETRNPIARRWEEWTPGNTSKTVDVLDHGRVQVHHATTQVHGQLVTYETEFHFPNDEVMVVSDTLRFTDREQLATILADAGLTRIKWYGDWNGSSFTAASPEIIVVASV